MALPALLGAGARAVGGSMVKSGGRAVAGKVLGRGRKKQAQPGRIIPGREGVDGGKGGAIIKPKVKMVSAKEIKALQTGDAISPGKDPLKSIYSNVKIIEKILKGTTIADREALKNKKKDDKKADKEAQEKKLETKPTKIDKAKGLIKKVPGMGIFGMIKNYIGTVLLGYFAVRLVKYLPQLLNLLKGIGKVVDFVADVGIFLVDGVATFIDFAYNVYDGTRNIMKGIGLEGAFDSIMKAVEVAITVLTFALGAKSLGGFGDSRGRGGKDKPGRSKPQTRIAGPKGNLLGSQDRVTSSAAARRYANRFGRDAAEKRFGKDAVSGLGGKFGRSRVTNFARGAATGVAKKLGGRQGVKMLSSLGKIGKFLKVPVIGSIISVVISLMNGDPIQKALFKGVGSAIGGALGGLLSTAIGVPPLGLFLGGIVGDYVGDLLYTLFFGGGLKAAGAKLGEDLKGMFTGIGDGAKAIFSWVFGGGLLDLLKNVGGGLLKFAGYILNPGGLLWDMLKAGGAVVGAITNFIFGGGLFDLIKNVGGGLLKFVAYILNPGGLLFDAIKAGGNLAKTVFEFALNAIGSSVKFLTDWIGGIFSRFISDFPTIGIPEGFGVQTALGKFLGWIPFLQPYMKDGRLTRFPDLSMFIPGIGMPFFFAHLGKSMFPGSFFEGLPSGFGDVWKGALDGIKDVANKVVEGTKRATGGVADFLTFNLFDFDKQNEVESKKAGGEVGRGLREDTLQQQKKATRKKPSFQKIKPPEGGKIKTGEKTDKAWWDFMGWAGTGGEDETMQLGPGGMMLANRVANVGNSFGDHPYFGPILSLAAKVILGQTPDEQEYKNVGYGLNMLIGDGISKGKINEGIKGYEDGGLVKDAMAGVDISRWATDTFRKELSETLYKNFSTTKSDKDEKGSDPQSPPGSGRRASRSRSGSSTGGIEGQGINKGIAIAKKLMVDMNISAAAASGIVGNLMLESGLIPDNVENGKGFEDGPVDNIPAGTRRVGYGYGQWTNDRLEKFRKFLTERGVNDQPATDDDNYAYLLKELNDDEPLFNHWKSRTSIPEDDPAKAATWFMMNWERPGVPHQDKRQEYARSIFDKIKGVTKETAKAEIEAAGGSFIPAGPATGEEGQIDFMDSDNLAGLDAGKPKKVYMHWTAGGYNSIVGPYHTIFTGDGTMHRRVPYEQHSDHTYNRNTNSVGLSVAAMAGAAGNYQWPKQAQLDGMTNEIARLANEWGWSSSDINIKNVMTHGEAGSNKDGQYMHDNYGPTVWGGTAERWDLDQLNPSQQIGEGGEILRGMIAKKLSSGEFMSSGDEDDARRSHAGTKLSNREEMLKILPGQSLLDENTSKALGATNLARFNAASTPEGVQNIAGQIAGVSDYAGYEQGAQQTVMVQDPPQQMPEESPQSSGGGMMVMSGGSSHDPFEFLDFQG